MQSDQIEHKQDFIERSVQFQEEPLAAVEVGESSSPPEPLNVSKETNEFDDSDMSDNDDLIAYSDSPARSKLAVNTIHASGELAGNPSDPRRTRSQFESALSVKDPLFAEKFYLMVKSDPQTYEDAAHDPRWQTIGIILGANFSPMGYFSMFFSQKRFAILHFLKPCFVQF